MSQILPESLGSLIRPGQTVFVPGSSGVPQAFVDSLGADPERSQDLHVITSFLPGVNLLDIDKLGSGAVVTGVFMQPSWRKAQREGRYRMLPLSYTGFVRYLSTKADVDLAVIQVSPPNEQGLCSLGPAVEFVPTVLRRCGKILALVNDQVPYIPGAPSMKLSAFDAVCFVDAPLPTYACTCDEKTQQVAANIASLIEDGDALQLGLGKVPMALAPMLRSFRKLRFHSGLLSDGFPVLLECGALDPDFTHTACVALGTGALYAALPAFSNLRMQGCEYTHDPRTLMALDPLVAVNSALEVDLFGQCNLEVNGGRAVSGAGGAPDFARGARLGRGRSIVALNACHKAGSRVVPVLGEGAVTSLSRVDVDYVVTEFGVADVGGVSVHERAMNLIAVAAPEVRDSLRQAWQEIGRRL